jgi:mannose-6-phosphate isomerase-like protein (cupin superfamily)
MRGGVKEFASSRLRDAAVALAPDGSVVLPLLALSGGSMSHFELAAGRVSSAVTHRTVEEIWFVVAGRGEMWRRQGEREETLPLEPGVCLTIPLGTRFQLRASASEPVSVIGVTMPPWPGDDEAIPVIGPWRAS